MHLVLLTEGWQGGDGLTKMGSFTTIRALSSDLKRNKKHRDVKERKSQNFAQTLRYSKIYVNLLKIL